jgi:hypothetical protein
MKRVSTALIHAMLQQEDKYTEVREAEMIVGQIWPDMAIIMEIICTISGSRRTVSALTLSSARPTGIKTDESERSFSQLVSFSHHSVLC